MKTLYWSLDVSTTNVGASLWDEYGKLIELKHLNLKIDKNTPVEFRDLHKANLLLNYVDEYKEQVKVKYNGVIKKVFIEAPLNNTPKNINTTALLLGFNGMARYILFQVFGFEPEKITVHESRKLFCTELVKTTKKRDGSLKETLSFPKDYVKNKKKYIWEKVAKLEPQIKWFYTRNDTLKPMCFDMTDSYAVGYAGLKKMGIL
jgi:hypothetical protein